MIQDRVESKSIHVCVESKSIQEVEWGKGVNMGKECCRCREILEGKDGWYGLHRGCFRKWFEVSELEEFLDVAIRSKSQLLLEPQKMNTSFFHGKFRKYSSRLGGMSYILKVKQKEYPELPVTEFVCNQIYESLKIEVPKYHLIRFPKNSFCFAVKNFMDSLESSTLIHFYHYVKEGMEYDCETMTHIIGEVTHRRTEQEKFAYLTLADSLIGNNDRHGRNLGFIHSGKRIELAPFYDNPSAIGVEESVLLAADLQPRGSIFTKASKEPTMKDYVIEWNRLGYESIIDNFRKNLSMEKVRNIIEVSFLSMERKKALLRLVTRRSEELWTT